jgi:eukaryotic-like serine/threonine-protein kinase
MTGIHAPRDLVGDRYEIDQYIGEGGMQEVYRANDLLLRRQVALKAPKNPSARKRFERSAIVSARVNHPNVAKTLDYFETDIRPYLIEELIDGKDLGKILVGYFSYVDPYLAAMVLHHLARGLAASHHADVIHRDLKPNNVMIIGGEYFRGLKITDFGIAKMAQEEIDEAIEGGDERSFEASQTALGAIPYMAPEVINAKAEKASDIWSAGAIVYELISGTKPFGVGYRAIPAILAAKPPQEPALIRTRSQFRPLGEIVYNVILACMSQDPRTRPTADQLVSECEKLCYSTEPREFGTIHRFDNPYWGFLSTPTSGRDVFFHRDSFYTSTTPKEGDRLFFARYSGGGNDRGFPLIAVKKEPGNAQ